MKQIKEFLKTFDQAFIGLILFSSAFIAFLFVYFYDFSPMEAVLLAPLAFLALFFGLILTAHILSFLLSLFDKIKKS